MVLQHRLVRTIGKAALACALLAPGPLAAADKKVEGEITRITKARTSVMVDLEGDLVLDNGATVTLTVDGKERKGTVKKVTSNGRAFIKLNKGLPKSVDVGDTIAMQVDSGDVSESEAAAKPSAVQLQKGGYAKAYWDEVSYLAAHRKPGTRADLEISYLNATGAEKAKGGAQQEDTEYAVTDKHTTLAGDVGWVGRGGFGAGLLLEHDAAEREVSADIDTASTSTTDSDKITNSRTITELMPYGQWQTRAKTGDIGFGVGVGYAIRTTTADRDVTIADEKTDIPEAKTTESGPSLELLTGTNSWAFIVGLTPVLSGKIKQGDADDVDHKSSEYGLHFETYGKRMKSRIGVILSSSTDDYEADALKESAYRISGRLDVSMGWFNLVPLLDYTSTKRTRGDSKGTFTETDVGARFAKAGRYAPFVSLSLNLRTAKESVFDASASTDRDVDAKTSGVRIAGGINI